MSSKKSMQNIDPADDLPPNTIKKPKEKGSIESNKIDTNKDNNININNRKCTSSVRSSTERLRKSSSVNNDSKSSSRENSVEKRKRDRSSRSSSKKRLSSKVDLENDKKRSTGSSEKRQRPPKRISSKLSLSESSQRNSSVNAIKSSVVGGGGGSSSSKGRKSRTSVNKKDGKSRNKKSKSNVATKASISSNKSSTGTNTGSNFATVINSMARRSKLSPSPSTTAQDTHPQDTDSLSKQPSTLQDENPDDASTLAASSTTTVDSGNSISEDTMSKSTTMSKDFKKAMNNNEDENGGGGKGGGVKKDPVNKTVTYNTNYRNSDHSISSSFLENVDEDEDGDEMQTWAHLIDVIGPLTDFTKEGEVNFLRMELNRGLRQRTLNMKRVVSLQQAMATLEMERESLKAKINVLEKDLEHAQKKLDENKRKVERLDKERSFVNRNLRRANAVTNEHGNQVKTHEVAVHNVQDAVRVYHEEIRVQKATITRLENERDFYSLESTKFAQQVAFQLTELKKLDLAILNYKKKLGGLETLLKKTQQTYDLAIYDKGVFERTLSDTLTEMLENNIKIKHLNTKVSALKYQVNEKDEIIHQEALRYDRILKETEFFSHESKRIKRMAEDIQRHTEALELERSNLGCSIAEMEGELGKENYYAKTAESRINVFHRKLMAKDVELKESWEMCRTLHSELRIGAYHFRNVMRDIHHIRYTILKYRKDIDSQRKVSGNYNKLRREETILENNIAREMCMINALKNQMRYPINVHRWRILEATNPEAYEMVLKINLLTKRLVDRNSLLKKQSKELLEKQQIYVEIRGGLERSPGLETPEEVLYCQHLLVAKTQQLHSLKHELTAAEAQVAYYREHVVNLHEKMIDLKKKFFKKLSTGTWQAKKLSKSCAQEIKKQSKDSRFRPLVTVEE